MPYIKQERRELFDPLLEPIIYQVESDGEVNYCITKIIDRVFSAKDYESFERAIGVLTCILLEYYRRRLVPFEDAKCAERGDVYE